MQRIAQLFGFVLMFFTASILQAQSIEVESPLPEVNLPVMGNTGELQIDDDGSIYYDDWSSAQLVGKARVVFHIAGRTSAREENEALIQAIVAAQLPEEKYQTSVLINLNDIIIGSGFFVRLQAQNTKVAFPQSSVVLDGSSTIQQAWSLQRESSAVVVLDQAGVVKFFKEGPLTAEEVQKVLTMVESLIAA